MPTDLCSLDTQQTCSLIAGSMSLDIVNTMMCHSYYVGALGIEPWGPENATNSGLRVKVTGRHCTAGATTPPSFLRLNEDNVTSQISLVAMSTNDIKQRLPDTGCFPLTARSNEVGIPACGRGAAVIPAWQQRKTSLAVEHSVKYLKIRCQCKHIPAKTFSRKSFVRLGG